MAAALVKSVDVLGIAEMRSTHRFGQRILGLRYCDNMYVIAHKTITEDIQPVFDRLVSEQLQIYTSIIINKEHILAIISPLGDMMSTPSHNCPC